MRDRRDSALIAFVERQTGIAHVRWLREPRDAASAIEAIKAWMTREAGVRWPSAQTARAAKLAVIDAQRRLLGDSGAMIRDLHDLDATIATLGVKIRERG